MSVSVYHRTLRIRDAGIMLRNLLDDADGDGLPLTEEAREDLTAAWIHLRTIAEQVEWATAETAADEEPDF